MPVEVYYYYYTFCKKKTNGFTVKSCLFFYSLFSYVPDKLTFKSLLVIVKVKKHDRVVDWRSMSEIHFVWFIVNEIVFFSKTHQEVLGFYNWTRERSTYLSFCNQISSWILGFVLSITNNSNYHYMEVNPSHHNLSKREIESCLVFYGYLSLRKRQTKPR